LPRLLDLAKVAQPVNLGRLADGTEIRRERPPLNLVVKMEGIWLLGDLAGLLFKLWK